MSFVVNGPYTFIKCSWVKSISLTNCVISGSGEWYEAYWAFLEAIEKDVGDPKY